MKTIESTHPLCGVCGRPIAFLILGSEVITTHGAAVMDGPTIVLRRHECQAPAPAEEPGKGRGGVTVPRRSGPSPRTLTQAMGCARNFLSTGPKSLQAAVNHLMSLGFKESTSRRALRLLDLVRSEEDGFITVRLPDAQPDPR